MALFQKPIPLDPGPGGRSIGPGALRSVDLIVSTTGAVESGGIRIGTGSSASHVKLYVGADQVVEAIGTGVVMRSLTDAVAGDTLAVAYRHPDMTDAIAGRIGAYAMAQVGKPYSVAGALLSVDKILCQVMGPRPGSFFCSQMVFDSYKAGGLPLSTLPPQCITPGDAVVIANQRLIYVGHLKGNTSWFPILSP